MKFTRLSTTSKLYLLTLLLIFGIFFINQSVFAQSSTPKTTSQKRLENMELYLSWINDNQYGQFSAEPGKKALSNFSTFLNKAIEDDKNCLNPGGSSPTFIQNITNFFSQLTGSEPQASSPQQISDCKAKILADYKLAKKYNRLLKYLQIEAGQPNICIRADLGVGTALTAKGFNPAKANSDNPKETGVSKQLPLYLCTGNDGKKKVRVVDDSGTRLRLSEEDSKKPQYQIANLPPAGSLNTLLDKLNLSEFKTN